MSLRKAFDNPLVRRLASGLGAHGALQFVLLLIRVLEVPLFLGAWGANRYGEWLMVTAIPASMTFADGGLTKTSSREMTVRAGRGDVSGMLQAFQTGWLMILALCAFWVVLTVLLLALAPVHSWLGISSVSATELSAVILIWTLQVVLNFQANLIYGAFASEGLYARATLLQALSFAMSFAGLAIGVILGGMTSAALGSLAGAVCGYVVLSLAFRASPIRVRFGFEWASLSEFRRVVRPSLATLAFPVGEALNIQGLRLLVGILFGPAALAVFSSTRTLCRIALQPVLSVARTVEPEMSMAYGGGDREREVVLFVKGTGLAVWLSVALCAFLLLAGPYLYAVWTKSAVTFDWSLFGVLLAASFVNALWSVSAALSLASNRHSALSMWFLLVFGAGAVSITYVGAGLLGRLAAPIGLLVSEMFFAAIAISYACGLVNLQRRRWIRSVANPFRLLDGARPA